MKCPNCKIELVGTLKRCPKCGYDLPVGNSYLKKVADQKAQNEAYVQARKETREKFKTTTSTEVSGYKIVETIGVKTGEAVIGTGIFSEFSASVSDLFGSANLSMALKLNEAKRRAIEDLIDNCIVAGGNAAIAIDVDIATLTSNMIVASACGTAVKIEKI